MSENETIEIHKSLINRCKYKDRQAQFDIYRFYSNAMYNTALRILNDTAEAEDAMQDAFLKAFQSIHDFRFESTFGVWLRKITINICLDILRKRKMVFEEIADKHNVVEEDVFFDFNDEAEILIEKIKTVMKKLPDKHRIILSLHLFEGFDYEEIAQITGISSASSRSQFFRARKKLIEELQKTKIHFA